MRARKLIAVVGAVFVLGPVSSASAVSLEEGITNLGNCDTDVAPPEVSDRDADSKAEKAADRSLIPDLYTPGMGSGSGSGEDYRPLRGGLFADREDRPTKSGKTAKSAGDERDTNNLDVDGGLSILCD